MTLSVVEREMISRIEGKIDDMNAKFDSVVQRLAVVETRQAECPARKWSQPSIVIATGALFLASLPHLIGLLK